MADARETLVRNEQIKLSATYLNGVAIGLAAVGGIAPVIALVQGTASAQTAVALTSVVCIAVSLILHFAGERLLKGLRVS